MSQIYRNGNWRWVHVSLPLTAAGQRNENTQEITYVVRHTAIESTYAQVQ